MGPGVVWGVESFNLKVEHQHTRLGATAAWQHLIVGLFLGVGEVEIPVIGLALEYAGKTGAAHALFARNRDIDAVLGERVGDGLVGCNVDDLAAAGDLYLERAVVVAGGIDTGEILAVQAIFGPTQLFGGIQYHIDEASGPTNIEVFVGCRLANGLTKVDALFDIGVVVIDASMFADSI